MESAGQLGFEKTGNFSGKVWGTGYTLSRAGQLFSPHPLQEAIQSLRASDSASQSPSGRMDLLRNLGYLWQLCSTVHEAVPAEPDPASPSPKSVASGHRSRELEWCRTHTEVLRQFAGQWIVLEREEIVAHGEDPLQVVAEARAKGIQVPYIFYVEDTDDNVVKMGL